jgi:3-oxoacyl-[acyl-carrier protein] reductase
MAADGRLDGKVAVVTGASSGIGRESAKLFANAGARVVVGYNRGVERANELAASLAGSGHKAMHLPLEDTAQIRKVAAAVGEEFGRCDILVNSAGFIRAVPHSDLEALTDDLIDRVLTANVRGPFATIRAFAPLLKASGDGVVINISSGAAQRGSGSSIIYGACSAPRFASSWWRRAWCIPVSSPAAARRRCSRRRWRHRSSGRSKPKTWLWRFFPALPI